MPDELDGHVRYPEDLFKLQRDILTRYHVDDPVDFFNQNDRWQVPADPTQDTEEAQPPYYILAQRPGDEKATLPADQRAERVQPGEPVLVHLRVRAIRSTYGQIQVLRLPGNTPFRGPQQVQQSFITNNQVRPDLTLFNSQDSRAVFGNLLTLPIGEDGLLYVEPLYVRAPGENSFPLLRKVLVNYGDRVGYADTLARPWTRCSVPGRGSRRPTAGTHRPPRTGRRRPRRRRALTDAVRPPAAGGADTRRWRRRSPTSARRSRP